MRERTETEDGGFRLRIAIDRSGEGSELWFGEAYLKPGTEPVSWDANDWTYEGYHVTEGSLRITWSGSDAGEAVVAPGEAFYFAPGRRYTLENAGSADAAFVWAVTPAPAAREQEK
jgi:quercetin dioxygenase-like cupin family protein